MSLAYPHVYDPKDVLRKKPLRNLSEAEKLDVEKIKESGSAFYDVVEKRQPSREKDIALMKIEEAVMWAVKSATR
jgi:hypothetical protein